MYWEPLDRGQRRKLAPRRCGERAPASVTRPTQKPVPQLLGMLRIQPEPVSAGQPGLEGGPREPGYLDGGCAAFLILALAQQTVGLHVVAGHWHGLHHVQAVAATEIDRAVGAGPQEAGSLGGEGLGKGEGVPREYGVYKGSGWRQPPSPTQSLTAPGHWPSEPALQSVPTGPARKTLTFPKLLPLAALVSPAMVPLLGLIHSKDFQLRAGEAWTGILG